MMNEDEMDKILDAAEAFLVEFKALVRKYVPEYPISDKEGQMELLHLMQDRTSCFAPYIWSDEK